MFSDLPFVRRYGSARAFSRDRCWPARAFSSGYFQGQTDPFPLCQPVQKFIEDHADRVDLFFPDPVDSLQGIVRRPVQIQEIMKPGLFQCRGTDSGTGVFQFPDRDESQGVNRLCTGHLPADFLQGFALCLLLPEDSGKIGLQCLKLIDQFFDLVKIRSFCCHPFSASCLIFSVKSRRKHLCQQYITRIDR